MGVLESFLGAAIAGFAGLLLAVALLAWKRAGDRKMAVLGAALIERHFTLNRAAKGTDHAASLEPKGLARLVQAIRRWEEARGTGELDGPIPVELPVLAKLRKYP